MTPWSWRRSPRSVRAAMTPEPEAHERRGVGAGPDQDPQVVGLVLLGDADLDEADRGRRVRRHPREPPGRTPRRRRSGGSASGWSAARASRCPAAPSRRCGTSRGAATGAGVTARRGGRAATASRRLDGPDAGGRPRSSVSGAGSGQLGTADADHLLAVAGEAGLHEQLHVAVGVGAGDVEAGGAALGAVAQAGLDQAEADVAGVAVPDGVELHDRPLVAVAVALHAERGRPGGRPPRRRRAGRWGGRRRAAAGRG